MTPRAHRLILLIAMLACFAGVIYSLHIGYDLGLYINAIALILLLLRWLSPFKEEKSRPIR